MRKIITLTGLMLLAGCGVTGTAPKSVYPKLTNDIALTKRAETLTVTTGVNASDNAAHGAFNWGAFSDEDVAAIKVAALDAINNNAPGAKDSFNIHVKIHKYAQVITNSSYASFVIVDWCIEDNGVIVSDEVFYAGHSDELHLLKGKSLGWAKGITHNAVVSRLINKAITYSSNKAITNAYPENHVFETAEQAVAALPKSLTSVGAFGATGGGFYYVGSSTGQTDFQGKSAYEKVDWARQLKLQ
ncbi:hypothetical protein HRH59_18145 [Rheinheimera sp. YQF-2]|uniref:Lipoprotein n=1 Tax=Rheinheimera lutimaris TaxID=2740584 RepID=A0A7Y5AU98_9GAMM|nr:hypothetical protein [Rheinheimera lutimaris]NRQ44464.1 hypothetical protein [Rheinheimera lutimaris]